MSPADFDDLCADFDAARQERSRSATRTKRGAPRRRAHGAGHPHAHDSRDRLLMAPVWLRIYPTYEVLGLLFDLHKTNARLNVVDALDVLAALADFGFERPAGERKKLGTMAAVMDAFPQVRPVVDAKEQRVERPRGYVRQKPFDSGKKEAPTVKNQVAVAPDGRIEAVGPSVPGGAHHDLTLPRASGLLSRLDGASGEGAMMDKEYVGIAKDHPELPLILPHKAARGHPLTAEQKAFNRVVTRYRIIVEHVMAQLNRFGALRQVFRSTREGHSQVIRGWPRSSTAAPGPSR